MKQTYHLHDNDLIKKAIERLKNIEAPEVDELNNWLTSVQNMQIYQEELTIQADELQSINEELTKLKKLYFLHFDMAPIAIFRINPEGKVLECNLAASALFGFDRQHLKSHDSLNLLNLAQGENYSKFKKHLESIAPGQPSQSASLSLTIHGQELYFRISTVLVKDSASGEPYELICYFTDLSFEKERDLSMRKMIAVLEQSDSSIIITGKDGLIEYVNPGFERVTGYMIEDVLGKNASILKSGRHPDEFYRELWDTILSGATWRGDIQNKKKSGEIYPVHAIISPITDPDGTIINFVGIQEDIS